MREVRLIDPYTAGEKPVIDVQFYEDERDLTGFSLAIRIERDGEELSPVGDLSWLDETKGIARFTTGDDDIDVSDGREWSRYKMELWAGNSDRRVATLLIVFDVHRHLGAEKPAV